MFSNKFGLQMNLGYDLLSNDRFGKNGVSLPFKSNYFRSSVEGVLNIGRVFNFETLNNQFGLLFHSGTGVSVLSSKVSPKADGMMNFLFGVTPQYKLFENVSLNLDLSFIWHIYQDRTYDMHTIVSNRGFDGFLCNVSAGASIYLGRKKQEHLDWVFSTSNKEVSSLKNEIKVKDSTITSLKYKLTDSDGDGVINAIDEELETSLGEAVNAKGVSLKNIDSDGDGVYDLSDFCLNEVGKIETNGCPDTDGDLVADKDDDCPSVAGLSENRGCPLTDSDGDGILDKEDECPMTAGTIENKGCPELEEEESKVLSTAFNNLEFESSKGIILETSKLALDELAQLLSERQTWKLDISGHTDNVGDDNTNMLLSKKRAEALKNYLVSKGISADRLRVFYFGETKPVAENNSEEGRKKNRRVEMKIVFE
jgi:outer membrane protein OmpA-like peptidoglycan-associated protein